GRFAEAVAEIRAALRLWKGEPCAGLPESDTFAAHRGRLIKLRETAVELLYDALLRQGDHGTVTAEVEAAINQNPLRERLTELGMMAFYRAGMQSEALALGRLLRSRLRDELGINPSPAIEAMELKILNHDRSLAPEVEPPSMPTARSGGAGPAGSGEGPGIGVLPELGALPTSVFQTDRSGDGEGTAGRGRASARHTVDRTTGTDAVSGPAPSSAPSAPQKDGRPVELTLVPDAPPLDAPEERQTRPTGPSGDSHNPSPARAAPTAPGPNLDLLAAPPTPFGRRDELNALESIGERLAAGTSATAIITGEPGIGKTTLVRSVASSLRDQGVLAAWSRSMPDRSTPLWSIAQVVLSLLEAGEDDPVVTLTPDLLPLAGLGPSVAGALAAPGQDAYDPSEIMLAVTRLLKRAADHTPIVLIFEDLHWADPETISVLHYAASTLADVPVGFVLTWRETELAGGDPPTNLRELSRLHPMIRVELGGLDDPAVLEMARAVGRPLSADETWSVHRRCDGNPLFVKEVLADPDLMPARGRKRSTLVDVVLDRVERLHVEARAVLAAAALSRRPFTPQFLTQLSGRGADVVQLVLGRAVRGGVLDEVEQPDGSFRFRHPLVAEVLESDMLSVDRSAMHRAAGHRLLDLHGPGFEVAHHLSNSPDPADRLEAARIALDLLAAGASSDADALAEAERYVAVAEETMAEAPTVQSGPWRDALRIDIGCFLAWRAWVDGTPDVWEAHARETLSLALTTVDSFSGAPVASVPVDLDRCLGEAAMTVAGRPSHPVGSVRTGAFATLKPEAEELLQRAVELLAPTRAPRWSVQLFLQARAAEHRPGQASQRKAARDAAKLLTSTRKKLPPAELSQVLAVYVTEFAEALEPQQLLQLLAELIELAPGFRSRVLEVRLGYPALLELGRSLDAELLTRKLLDDALAADVGLFVLTEAKQLMARHLLWTGQLETADDLITEAMAAWRDRGLAQPVPLVRQRRTVRLLRKAPLTGGHGPDEHHQLLAERSTSPELAFRLARLGDTARSEQCLDQMLELVGVQQIPLSDQAFLALAAALTGHEKAALTVLDMLKPAGDRPVARADGSVIFGPASLYASLAAQAAGRERDAKRHMDAAGAAVRHYGGAPASLDVITSGLEPPGDSNPAPTDS
ncbi:MAG: BTAD domain-containing putative transcriptional regulator, partial [Actinomycetota bacterium]